MKLSAIVQELLTAGLSGQALVDAISRIEAASSEDATVTASAIRMRKYREHRKANGMDPNKPEYVLHSSAVKDRDFHMCVYCGSDESLVIDHMIPVCQGGTDHPDNLATACRACNASKAGKTPEQWGRKINSAAANDALLRYVALVARTVALSPSPLVPPLSPAPLTPPIIPPTPNLAVRKATRKSVAYSPAFETFWTAYPVDPGMSKQEAFAAWGKLSGEDQQSASQAIPGFKAWVAKQGKDYRTVHACRYLSQRRFDGFKTAPKPFKADRPFVPAMPASDVFEYPTTSQKDVAV